jgi:hypothetical protein
MRRQSLCLIALLAALALPSGALAAQTPTLTGTVTAISPSSLTIQAAGRPTGMIATMIATADAITKRDYPYVWAGGHAQAGVPSTGSPGPGYNGHRVGFDCSGSVTAVLAGAGLWPAGSPVPGDADVIGQLLQDHLIAPGAGTAPDEVTLYDHPGVHIFMNINGRFFGTSDGGGGNSKGGPSWLDDGAFDAADRAFKRYHVLPSVLNDTAYGQSFTFQLGPNAAITTGFVLGDDVQVGYRQAGNGTMTARTLGYAGAVTTDGIVTSTAADGSSFRIDTAHGQGLTLSVGDLTSLVSGLQIGDKIDVTYTKTHGTLTARAVTVTAPPAASQVTGSISSIAADLSSFTLQTPGGRAMTFSTGGDTSIVANVSVGDEVLVTYVRSGGGNLTAHQVASAKTGTNNRGDGS